MLKWSEGHASIMWEICKDCGQTRCVPLPSSISAWPLSLHSYYIIDIFPLLSHFITRSFKSSVLFTVLHGAKTDTSITSRISSGKVWKLITLDVKGKWVPLQARSGPEGSRNLRFPDFMTTAQNSGKVVSLMHRPPLPPSKYTWYSFLLEDESTPGP